MNRIVDPTAKITGQDAQDDADRQGHQSRHQADDQRGAHTFENLVKNILPDLVGAENMVIDAQGQHRGKHQQQDGEARQHGVPGKFRFAAPQTAPGRQQRPSVTPRQQGGDAQRYAQHEHQRQNGRRQRGMQHIGVAPRFIVAQMRAAVFEARKIALRMHAAIGAAHLDRFLCVGAGRQRR